MSHTYTESDDLRGFPAAVRVYSYVLHILEPFDESHDLAQQYAAQQALGTADRNLVRRASAFVDPETNDLDQLSIRKYVMKTLGYKRREAHRIAGPSLDANLPGQVPLSERLGRDVHGPLASVDEGAFSDLERHDAELEELRELAARQERERAVADFGPRVVRRWADSHPGDLTAADADILVLRARGLDYWAIADALRPEASTRPAARKRARAWARARASRARPKLPEDVARHLPSPNKNGDKTEGR